jgi:hypothetical protein
MGHFDGLATFRPCDFPKTGLLAQNAARLHFQLLKLPSY